MDYKSLFTDDNTYYRNGTYGDATSYGTKWTNVTGKLKTIDVGDGFVVGTSGDKIYMRTGMFPSPVLLFNYRQHGLRYRIENY